MPNVINYAEKWQPRLLDIQIQNTLTSPFIVDASAIRWEGAKTFHFTRMATSGLKNHSRDGGWNKGAITQVDHPFTIEHDRDIEFFIDRLDVDESNYTASLQNVGDTFEKTQVAPEIDARFFEKVSAAAIAASKATARASSYYTANNVIGALKGAIDQVRPYRNSAIAYVSTEVMSLLETALVDKATIAWTTVSDLEFSISTRVANIDGVPVMEVYDDSRFATEFDYAPSGQDGGFAVDSTNGNQLAIAVASTSTVVTVSKVVSVYAFAPGEHTEGDGYLYQHRDAFDTFVFPNGKNGQVDSVYIEYIQ